MRAPCLVTHHATLDIKTLVGPLQQLTSIRLLTPFWAAIKAATHRNVKAVSSAVLLAAGLAINLCSLIILRVNCLCLLPVLSCATVDIDWISGGLNVGRLESSSDSTQDVFGGINCVTRHR